MTLGTHAVVGATLATLIPSHPALAFLVGFGSHFLLDAIPHWDYTLYSIQKDDSNRMNTDMKIGKVFLFDLCRIGLDVLLGCLVIFLFFIYPLPLSVGLYPALIIGAIGAMLPDALQFVYYKWRHQPIVSLQRFHMFIHTNIEIKNRPVLGITLQVITVLVVYIVVLYML